MKALKVILVILLLVLLVEVGFLVYENFGDKFFATHPTTEATTAEMIQDAPTEAPTTEGISLELPPAVTGTPTDGNTTLNKRPLAYCKRSFLLKYGRR